MAELIVFVAGVGVGWFAVTKATERAGANVGEEPADPSGDK